MKIDTKALSNSQFASTEFFIFCWNPGGINTEYIDDNNANFAINHDDNFFSVSSISPYTGEGLVRKFEDNWIVFRGYDVDLSIASYMSQEKNDRLVSSEMIKNGVFAYIKYNYSKNNLVCKTDAFGIAPLYYREINGCYLFSSHPALISVENDEPDYIAWASLLMNGYIFGERSFYSSIKRFPAGTEFFFSSHNVTKKQWYDFSLLPLGDKKIDDESFRLIEDSCQKSIDKCLNLTKLQVLLPFSSGFDSRRFFASFQKRGVKFKAATCQSFHNKNGRMYDIDSIFAAMISRFFGNECEIIAATNGAELHSDLKERQSLIGTETFMHDWAMPLMRWLRQQEASVVFDGLGGDTLGNSGFVFDCFHEDPQKDKDIVLDDMVITDMFKFLSKEWPSVKAYNAECKSELGAFPSTMNGMELAFLLFRARRAISPWITMMQPPGHLVVFPYLDLGFVETCLRYHPAEKYHWFFQKECLKRFWPEYYDFPGTRNLPEGFLPISKCVQNSRRKEFESFLFSDSDLLKDSIRKLTSLPMFYLWRFSTFFPFLRKKRNWFFTPLIKLVKYKKNCKSYIVVD
jgi:hypothetical protein